MQRLLADLATLDRLVSLTAALDSRAYQSPPARFRPSFGLGDAVIPPCAVPVEEPRLPLAETFDQSYPLDIQPFNPFFQHVFEIGRDNAMYGALAPLLLASTLAPSETLDYKAYCVRFCAGNESNITAVSSAAHRTADVEMIIRTWVQASDIPNRVPGKIFRRCIVIRFMSEWTSDEGGTVACGHAMTLGMELRGRALTLQIFDYRMHEYIYNVHDRLFQWMTDAVRPYADHFASLRTEMVCLKGRLNVDPDFMTCMSAAFRVVLHQSIDAEWHESEEEFNRERFNLEHHIFRMMERHRTSDASRTVLISPQMAHPFFELSRESCYLLLAPHPLPGRLAHLREDPLAIVEAISKTAPRLRYSPTDGFVETGARD
jgi:hypothetical protein